MGKASALSFFLFLAIVLAAAAQTKPPAPPTKPPAQPDKLSDTKTDAPLPPRRVALSTLDEVEGKNLDGWLKDLSDPDPCVRQKALVVIPAYGPSAMPHVPRIVECLDHTRPIGEDLGPRSMAIAALGVMDISEHDKPLVVQSLAYRLQNDPQAPARLQAAIALSRFGEEDGKLAIPGLIAGINDRASWEIRKASIMALRRIASDRRNGPNDRATRALSFLLNDPVHLVRIEAIQAVGYMDRPKDEALLKRLRSKLTELTNVTDHSSVNDIKCALWAHVSLMALVDKDKDKPTDDDVKAIRMYLSHKLPEVRFQAVLCVGTLGVKAKICTNEVIKLLKDKEPHLIGLAAWSLVSIGEKDPDVIQKMTEVTENKELPEYVRGEVKAALEALKNRKPEPVMSKEKDKEKPIKP
jgi:HEAT repeat protein